MPLAVLLQTSPTSAEAVVEQLEREGIEALVVDRPHWLAWLASFGTYRVRVAVEESSLAEARAALARAEPESRARIRSLSGAVYRQLAVGSVPALLLLCIWFLFFRHSEAASIVLLASVGLTGFLGVCFAPLLWRRAQQTKASEEAPAPEAGPSNSASP